MIHVVIPHWCQVTIFTIPLNIIFHFYLNYMLDRSVSFGYKHSVKEATSKLSGLKQQSFILMDLQVVCVFAG